MNNGSKGESNDVPYHHIPQWKGSVNLMSPPIDIERSPSDRRPNLSVVIRAAGERTADVCRCLIAGQVPDESITVLNERPFEQALRRCYEIGIESGKPWLLVIDADMLVCGDAVTGLLDHADSVPDNVFQVVGRFLDKFTIAYRRGGVRLVRAALLEKALTHIHEPGKNIRPESYVDGQMSKAGHPTVATQTVVGLHDYEQYYRDVYRKAFIHGRKHANWIGSAVPQWKQVCSQDLDFRVALSGFFDGYLYDGRLELDVDALPTDVSDLLASLGTSEKKPLDAGALGFNDIQSVLSRLGPPPFIRAEQDAWSNLRHKYRRIGAARLVPIVIGRILTSLGSRLERAAKVPVNHTGGSVTSQNK